VIFALTVFFCEGFLFMDFDISKVGGTILAQFLKGQNITKAVTHQEVATLIGQARKDPKMKPIFEALGNLTEADLSNVANLVNKAKGFS
jgi:hypothetical protein